MNAWNHEKAPAAITGCISCHGSYFGEKQPFYGAEIIFEFMVDVCSVACVSENNVWLQIKGKLKAGFCVSLKH